MQESITPDESLRIISSMIEKTKKGISDRSQYFLIWGWGTFLACIAQFILKVIFLYPYHYRVWLVIVPCFILSTITGFRNKQKQKVKTYVSETMSELWLALGVTFFVMIILFSKLGWKDCYPFYIMLYGLGTFMSGRILKFRPLIIGGIVCWLLAVVCVWVKYDYQILFTAAALLVSYIIPGHMLRHKFINQY